jgi:predicted CXXCH cytochrome family protein
VVLVLAACLTLWLMRSTTAPPADSTASAPSPSGASQPVNHVDNRLCLGCHQVQARQWQSSHHAQAMNIATAATVRGDFNDTLFKHQGVATRFFKKGDKFFVHTDGPDGKLGDFEIGYTFGYEPLQQYLIAMPGGRLQPLQIAWDTRAKRWFRLLPNEKAPAGDVLHWTGRYQTANTMCIACHTTGFEKRYDADSDSFASTWKEPNVSCQSCHGPGEGHAQWARLNAEGQAPATQADKPYGLVVDFRAAGAPGQVEVCAACHSRRGELTATPVPGQPLLNQHLPSLLQAGLYHPDGQQLDEVFVDGSYRQSKMYGKGVACTDCHDAHSGKLKLAGNAVCMQCHTTAANPKFASAAGAFDTPAHHFHQAGSAGAQCVACHMPSTNYMQIQARPDHSLRVPRPDLSVKLGTPNACTQCHADKPAQWAADRVAAWYGPKRRQETHYGETFAAARAGQLGAPEALARIVADRNQPAIVRATALDGLRNDPGTGDSARIEASRDADPVVRAAAADSLEALPEPQRLYGLTPLLSDPIRAVRIAAARALSTLARDRIDAATRPAFDAALAEYIAAQKVSLDMPGAQLNLAVIYQNTARIDLAEKHYLNALRIDPDFTPARANLARLYNASARNADAERVLTEGLRRLPDLGELQYSLGLLLAEEQRLPEAARALTQAARLLPERAKVHYNLGLALQQLGRRKPAEAALLQAQRLDPLDSQSVYALAVFYAQGGQGASALQWAEKLQSLNPADPQVRQFVQNLTEQVK